MKLGMTALALAGLTPSNATATEASEAQIGRCHRSTLGSAVIDLRTARAALLAVPPEGDGTSVPPPASRRIETLKDRMRDFVRAMMACAPSSVEPTALAAAMEQRSGVSGGTTGDAVPPSDGRHGSLIAFEVSRVESHPDMLAVVARLGIRCGSDSVLMLYRRTASGWREAMVRRSEPYAQINGGWGDLRFAVSPDDAQGRWFVATVTVTPWCTSAWQGLSYALARPGPVPDRPSVFFKEKGVIYLGDENDLLLKAEPDAFEIRYDGASLDPEILIRRHVRRYSIANDSVKRVQPVAENLRDFADEWIRSPWSEAADWSQRSWFEAPHWRVAGRGKPIAMAEFVSIRACDDGAAQVELAHSDTRWFLKVRGGSRGPWTVERIGAVSALAECTGPDQLPRKPD